VRNKLVSMQTKGYSLLEILIVLVIIGVVFSVGIAQFRDFSRRQAVRVAARQLLGDIREIQSQALSGKKPAGCTGTFNGIRFAMTGSSGPPQYEIQAQCSTASPAANVKTLADSVYIQTPLPGDVVFRTVANGTNLVAGSSRVVTVCASGISGGISLTISASGDVTETEVTCP